MHQLDVRYISLLRWLAYVDVINPFKQYKLAISRVARRLWYYLRECMFYVTNHLQLEIDSDTMHGQQD